MWIDRLISPLLIESVRTRPALVLTGGRQTGKTSLVRHTFPDYNYVSLDLPAEAALAEEAPEVFLTKHQTPLIVDEVQYAPKIFRHLKKVIDDNRDVAGQFILTGSQPFELMKEVGDSLAGRVVVLTLEGLTWVEARQAMPDITIEELIWRGGFPELYANPAINVAQFHADYVATYLERDIRNLLQIGNLRDFDRFIRACAARTSGLLNMADLGRDCGVTSPTVKSWLSTLERSGQVSLLEPWFAHQGKGLTKSPKIHLSDSGLACFLTAHRSAHELLHSPMIGSMWETAVYGELRKGLQYTPGLKDLYFYRNRTREVDFIIERAGRVLCADAKWSELPNKKDRKQVEDVVRELISSGRSANAAIFCRCPNSFPLSELTTACSPADIVEFVLG